MTTLKDLDRTDYKTYTADDSVLADYGLDAPAVTFTGSYTTEDKEQGSFSLAFGKKGDNCYMRMDDSPIIYAVDSDTYTNDIADTGYDTLRPDEVLKLNWDDVKSIDFTIDGTTYTVEKKGDTYKIGDDVVEFDDVQSAVDGLKVKRVQHRNAFQEGGSLLHGASGQRQLPPAGGDHVPVRRRQLPGPAGRHHAGVCIPVAGGGPDRGGERHHAGTGQLILAHSKRGTVPHGHCLTGLFSELYCLNPAAHLRRNGPV